MYEAYEYGIKQHEASIGLVTSIKQYVAQHGWAHVGDVVDGWTSVEDIVRAKQHSVGCTEYGPAETCDYCAGNQS